MKPMPPITIRIWRRLSLMALLALCVIALTPAAPIRAQDEQPDPVRDVGFDQLLDQSVPLDALFTDEEGRTIPLRDFFGEKPVVLALGYYECPMLCSLVREGMLQSFSQLDFTVGDEFEVVNVSIDPGETPMIAAAQKAIHVERYGRPGGGDGWHFLTGDQEAIDRLASAVGFRYVYDAEIDQYAHPSGIIVLTPLGKIARYFYGIEFDLKDLRLGLVEASENKIGTPVDQFLLLCYHYDPVTGTYTGLIMTITRVVGALTILILGGALFMLNRRHRRGIAGTAG